MTETSETTKPLEDFLGNWVETPNGIRKAFITLTSHLETKSGTDLEFVARQGLTYSIRASHENHGRPLFAIIDVIEDEPRWLSVCFYEDMIQDPENRGNLVPNGILGEDGHCFDVETYDETYLKYLRERIDEAFEQAAAGS